MKKVAIGCGIVSLIVLGLGVLAVVQVGRWAKDTLPDFEETARLRAEIEANYGTADEFVPPENGVYDPARVGIFVEIREQIRPGVLEAGSEINAFVERARSGKGGGFGGFFTQMGSAFGAVGQLAHLAALTDSLLFDGGMGRGEFSHLQLVLTRGWMDLDARRAEWRAILAEGDLENDGIKMLSELDGDAETRASELLRVHLENLHRAVGEDAPDSVRAYVDSLDDRDRDFPFTDPVPPSLAAAFDTYATRLRATTPATYGAWLAEATSLVEEENDDASTTRSFKIEF